jgi:hypothetical protein
MSTMKKLIPVIVLSCMGLIFIPLYGQEEPSFMYHDKKEEGKSDSIYTGLLIAYGELYEPPFLVEMRDDTVWVNDLNILPSEKIWHEEYPEIEVSETRKQQYAIKDSVFHDFLKFHRLWGETDAPKMTKDKYKDNPLISKIFFGYRDTVITSITIEWLDGKKEGMSISELRSPDGKIIPYPRPTHEELMEDRRTSMETMKSELRRGYLVVESCGFGTFRRPGKETDIFLEALRNVAREEIPTEQAREQYKHILPGVRMFWKEFDLKRDTWK